jgi:hypothetical protein
MAVATSINSPGPALDAEAITNDVAFSRACRGIYVGVAGIINLELEDGGTVVFKGAAAGSVIPIRAVKVLAATTTATDLVALL